MKKHFKGFTLVECLIALAILGIASLTMAQIYANVSNRNRMNHLVNTSLSNQMAYVEKYTDSQAVAMYFGGGTSPVPDPQTSQSSTTKMPPHRSVTSGDLTKPYVQLDSSYKDPSGKKYSYSYSADIYVLKSRDRDDNTLDKTKTQVQSGDVGNTAGYGEDSYNLRYKYIIGHLN